MIHQIWEYEQPLRIQSSHPKLFCILGAKFCCIHYSKYPTTFVDHLDLLLILCVDCLFKIIWHTLIEMKRTSDDHVVLFEQTLAKNRKVIIWESKTTWRAETKGQTKLRDLLNTLQQLQQARDKKAQIAHKILSKESPNSIILCGRY